MRKLMVVAAMLAMMLLAASPAMADEIEIEGDDGVLFTSNVEDFDGDDFEDFFDEVDFFSFESVDSDFDEVEF